MMMDRRAFSTALLAAAATSLTSARGMAANATPTKASNIVLVHGLFADGSCWSEVIARLQAAGLNATAVQNPLTTLPDAVETTERVLARQVGPTVLVGHSFSGMIVTEAGVHPNVTALVYVAARAPDAGEDYSALAKTYPTPPATAGIVFDGDEGRLSEEAFLRDFAGDLPEARAKVLYAVQEPFHKALIGRQDDARGLAVEAEFLCRIHGGPDDRSRSRTLHGQAHGSDDDRGEGKPFVAHLASTGDHRSDPGRCRPPRIASEPDWPRRRSVHSPGMLKPAAINVRRHQRMLNMKETFVAAVLISAALSAGPATAASAAYQDPLEARTLSTIRSRFSELIEMANRHDLKRIARNVLAIAIGLVGRQERYSIRRQLGRILGQRRDRPEAARYSRIGACRAYARPLQAQSCRIDP